MSINLLCFTPKFIYCDMSVILQYSWKEKRQNQGIRVSKGDSLETRETTNYWLLTIKWNYKVKTMDSNFSDYYLAPRNDTSFSFRWIFFDRLVSEVCQKSLPGLPGCFMVQIPPANAGDTGSIPGPGRSHMPHWASEPQPPSLCSRDHKSKNDNSNKLLKDTHHTPARHTSLKGNKDTDIGKLFS